MTAPKITIQSISKSKISDEQNYDQAIVTFTADQDITAWEARADGLNHQSGLLVGRSEHVFPSDNLYPSANLYPNNYVKQAGSELQFVIEDEELQQDGNYRINIYACNSEGEWTPYE